MAITIIKSGDDDTGLLEYCSVAGPATPVTSLESDRADAWATTGSSKWVSYGSTGKEGSRPSLTGSVDRRKDTPTAMFFRKFSIASVPTSAVLTVWSSCCVSVYLNNSLIQMAPSDPRTSKVDSPGVIGGSTPITITITSFPQTGWLRFDTYQVENVAFGLRWQLEVTHP